MSEYPINIPMCAAIVQSQAPVTLLGGAPLETILLEESLRWAPRLVAADGGAGRALAAGHVPEAVIGDMDSLTPADRARLDPATILRVEEQDSTDFHKALMRIAAPLVLAVGFTGARLDHELAVYNVLARLAPGRALVIGGEDICCHAPMRFAVDLPVGTRVSLFPMAPVTGRSRGLRWPLDGIPFAPDGRVATSNRAAAGRVSWDLDRPGMLAIFPRACLNRVVPALLSVAPDVRAG